MLVRICEACAARLDQQFSDPAERQETGTLIMLNAAVEGVPPGECSFCYLLRKQGVVPVETPADLR